MAASRSRGNLPPEPRDRPDVFVSYAREDKEFVERRLTKALVERGKDVWIDVQDIRGGASDWRASVWAGIEAAKVFVFVLTPDALASTVCAEELRRSEELNKRIIPVLRRPVDDASVPPVLGRPNWILARLEDDFETSVAALVDALELDEPWVEQHARLTQRTVEWVGHDRDGSYLLRGSDLRAAERWLDDQGGHREAPTADQVTYVTASRRAAARRQQSLLAGVVLALAITVLLAVVAFAQRQTAIANEKRARTEAAQARAAQALAELSRDPEASLQTALAADELRPDLPAVVHALRRVVSSVQWRRILRLPHSVDTNWTEVEFSDDGRRVATGGFDDRGGRAAVWDARTGRLVRSIHTMRAVRTVQFSPDGRQLLTASEDGVAQTWDWAPGQRPLRTFDTNSQPLRSATWGANGRRIFTAGPGGGHVWDVAGGRPRLLPGVGQNYGATKMSLDGRRALTPGTGGNARLWDAATGKLVRTLPGKNEAGALVFSMLSADGRRFATFYERGGFCVWDDRRSSPVMCGTGHPSVDVDFSRNGRRALWAASSGVVEVWDAVAGAKRPLARLQAGTKLISAQFDRRGENVVVGTTNGSAQVWHVRPMRRLAVLRGHTRGVERARFSRNGRLVATVAADGSARLWPSHPRMPKDSGWWSADSTSFGPGSRDVLLVRGQRRAVWNTHTGNTVELAEGGVAMPNYLVWPCGRAAGCAPWSRNGRLVAGVTRKGGAVLWDARTGGIVTRFGKPSATAVEAAIRPDGRLVVVVDGERSRAQIWNRATARPTAVVPAGDVAGAALSSAQFVASQLRVLTVDSDGRARLSRPTGESFAFADTTSPPATAATRDGAQIAVGTTSGDLRVVFGASGASRTRHANPGTVSAVGFNRAGTAIVTGGQMGRVTTWDASTLAATPLTTTEDSVTGAGLSRGAHLVLVSAGASAALWDRTVGRLVVEFPQTPDARVEFSPDEKWIALAGKTRLEVVRCYACMSTARLEQRARSLLPAS